MCFRKEKIWDSEEGQCDGKTQFLANEADLLHCGRAQYNINPVHLYLYMTVNTSRDCEVPREDKSSLFQLKEGLILAIKTQLLWLYNGIIMRSPNSLWVTTEDTNMSCSHMLVKAAECQRTNLKRCEISCCSSPSILLISSQSFQCRGIFFPL